MLFDMSMKRSQVRMRVLIYYRSMGEVSTSDKRKLGTEFEYRQRTGFGRFVQRGDFPYSIATLLTLKSLFGGQLINEKTKAWWWVLYGRTNVWYRVEDKLRGHFVLQDLV